MCAGWRGWGSDPSGVVGCSRRRWGAWVRGEEVKGGGSEQPNMSGRKQQFPLGAARPLLGEVQGSHHKGILMWLCPRERLCPAELGGGEVWLRLSFLILLVLGVLKLGCSVTPSQSPAVCGCKQTVPDCSSGWGEGTLSC